jgi:hypothetical protein
VTESLRDIRIFVAAYEERSFTVAAVREHATQSGVSQHIRKLEEGFELSFSAAPRDRSRQHQLATHITADAFRSCETLNLATMQ